MLQPVLRRMKSRGKSRNGSGKKAEAEAGGGGGRGEEDIWEGLAYVGVFRCLGFHMCTHYGHVSTIST